MSLSEEAKDVVIAAVDIINRMGAVEFEVGHLDDDVPSELARWWASAQWHGTKVFVEDHAGPAEASEALALKLLEGGTCTHCGQQVTTRYTTSKRKCRWERDGERWVRGCRWRIAEGTRVIEHNERGTIPQV